MTPFIVIIVLLAIAAAGAWGWMRHSKVRKLAEERVREGLADERRLAHEKAMAEAKARDAARLQAEAVYRTGASNPRPRPACMLCWPSRRKSNSFFYSACDQKDFRPVTRRLQTSPHNGEHPRICYAKVLCNRSVDLLIRGKRRG